MSSEKRALLAITLALVVVVAWQFLFPPPPRPERTEAPPAAAETAPGSSGAAGIGAAPPPAEPAEPEPPPEAAPPPDRLEADADATLTIRTEVAEIVLANRGARLRSWALLDYSDDEGHPYELVSRAGAKAAPEVFPLDLRTGDEALDRALAEALFVPSVEKTGDGRTIASFAWSDGAGVEARKSLEIDSGGYLCRVEAAVTRDGRPVEAGILWGPGIGGALAAERASTFDYAGRIAFRTADGLERIDPSRVEAPGPLDAHRGLSWAGVEERYFVAFFLPDEGIPVLDWALLEPYNILPEPGGKHEQHVALVAHAGGALRLYAGPKEYDRLNGMGPGTGRLVDFAFPAPLIGSVLSPVIEPLAKLLYFCLRWLYGLVPNWGVAIVLLTTAIKILFYPITQRAFVKMRRVQQEMQTVQPKIRAIREKYRKIKGAEARQKMNQEVMDLYKREGINPMAGMTGCLPLLLQLPILYAFYNVLMVSIELRKAPFFGWITDLSQKDPLYVTPILMGATMFLQQKMAMAKVTDPQQRAQQRMMLFMPLMFTFFFLGLPAGLTLYWFVSNLLQIGQQVLINRQADAQAATAAAAAGPAPRRRGKAARAAARSERSGSGRSTGSPAKP